MSPNTFRLLLVAACLAGIAGWTIDLVFSSLIPDALAQAMATVDSGPASPGLSYGMLAVGVVAAVGGLAAAVGLFAFRPWARRLALVATACALLFWLAFGVNVYSGAAIALVELAYVLWGAVLAAAYGSPLSERFAAVPPRT